MAPETAFANWPLEQRLQLAAGAPSPFYMTGEDGLQLSGWNITAGVRLTVSGRFLTLEGRIQSFSHDVALTTDRVIASVVRSLGEGWLLNFTVTSGGTSSPFGQTFARVQVVRGLAASGAVLGTLCAGPVTSAQPIAFPGGRVRSMVEGPGSLRSITGTNPAAGAEITETVPTGARWKIRAFNAILVTDATVANRFPSILIDDTAADLYASDPAVAQTASQSMQYFAAHGVTRLAATFIRPMWAFPVDMTLLAGWRVRTVTQSLQAGDNWGAPQMLVEEWLDAQ